MRLSKADRQEIVATLVFAVLIVIGALLAGELKADEVPQVAHKYRADLTRNARHVWGLDAPIATFAAQVHQESGWNPLAVSRVGAQGMAQFMPATARWWCAKEGTTAADCQPQNPVWALRSLAAYDRWLWDRINAATPCDRMAMTLSAYNGGLGWVFKERKLTAQAGADPQRWFGHVAHYNAGRSHAAFTENRHYPERILLALAPRYAAWGKGSCA